MDDFDKSIDQLVRLNKLKKEDGELLINKRNLEKEIAAIGNRSAGHHQREIAALRKKLNITEDIYDFEYTQKKKLFALDKAERAAGKTGTDRKKYIKKHEAMEYKSFFKLTKEQRHALRKDLVLKKAGIKKIHELERAALKKDERERKKYERSYKVKEKGEVASKGLFRAAGQVAGDIDNAVETAFKPFHNKSINPLKWLKQGSDVGKDLEDSSENFKVWGEALKKAAANRKMRAGKEIKAREQAEKDAGKTAEKEAEKIAKGRAKPKDEAKPKGRAKPKDEAKPKGRAKPKPKDEAKPKGRAKPKPKDEAKPKGRAKPKPKDEAKPKSRASTIIVEPKKQSLFSKLFGGGDGENTKKTTKKATGGSTAKASKASGGAGIKNLGSFMAATKGLGMLVTVVELLAKALGALSKLNWLFAIISALAGVISKISELDDYIKGLNRTFATMAGPAVGLDSIGKEMGTFNDALFDVRRNMKLGLKGEDISKMFGSVASEGLAPQVLATKASSYDDAITGIRKSSVLLGVSFEDMGKMVGEQMRDLRSSFDETRDVLQEVGYNAAKAGINTNKFYAAIENSASALSYMGNYMGVASANLNKFIKEGTLGFKDASQAASTYMQVFQKMDWKSLQKVFEVTGSTAATDRANHPMLKFMEENKKATIDEPLAAALKKREDLNIKLEETRTRGGDTSEIAKQLAEVSDVIRGFENRAAAFESSKKDFMKLGTVATLAQSKELLTGNVAKTIALISARNPSERDANIEILKTVMDIDANFIRDMDLLTQSIKTSSNTLASTLSGDNAKLISNADGALDLMSRLVEISSQPDADFAKLQASFKTLGTKIYKNEADSDNFSKSIIENLKLGPDRINEVKSVLQEMKDQLYIAKNSKDAEARSKATEKLRGLAEKLKLDDMGAAGYADYNFSLNKDIKKGTKSTVVSNEKLWKEYIKKTVSLKDRGEILKESANYAIAKLATGPADVLNVLVAGIADNVDILASDKRKKQEDSDNKTIDSDKGTVVKLLATELAEIKASYKSKGYGVDEYGNEPDLTPEKKADKKKMEELMERKKKAQQLELGFLKSKEDKARIISKLNRAADDELADKSQKAYLAKEEAAEKAAASKEKEKQNTAKELAAVDKAINEKPAAKPVEESKTKRDYRTEQRGLTLLDKGDYAINPSTGVGKPKGAFAQEIISKMFGLDGSSANLLKGGAAPSSISISLGGLHVNGDVSDPQVVQDAGKKVTEMIEQAIRKHEREKQYA